MVHLFKRTFKWWLRLKSLKDNDPLLCWWNHWLSTPPEGNNPYSNFLIKLKFPTDLAYTPLIQLTHTQIIALRDHTLNNLKDEHKQKFNSAIYNYKFHLSYKYINDSSIDSPQSYLTDPFPYIFKSFLC